MSPSSLPSTPDDRPDFAGDLAGAYAQLNAVLLERPDVTGFLDQAIDLAVSLTGAGAGGVTLRRDGEIATVAISDDFAARIDEIQYGRGQGPCLESLHSGLVVTVDDLEDDERWTEYRTHALARGVRSSLSLPLEVDGLVRGALNLYSQAPNTFGKDSHDRGGAFARQVGTALTLLLRTVEQQVVQDQLRQALEARAVIDQALGIIMAQQGVDARAAFTVLREASQQQNRKLSDVAGELIELTTGQPPVAPRPFTDPR